MRIEKSPYSQLRKAEQGSKLFFHRYACPCQSTTSRYRLENWEEKKD
jgi:hypothetical protein